MKQFIISNYVLILSILLISIITVIGYLVDKRKIRIEKKNKDDIISQNNMNAILYNSVMTNQNDFINNKNEGKYE